jgi:mxaJ protein
MLLSGGGAIARELRVCADPNNLPFSNERGEGFENKIVAILAEELGATVEYTWWAQRRGFLRNTLKAELCDLVPGTPSNMEGLRTTAPYYRSTYVFVTRADGPGISSFNDPALRDMRVGVQLVGDDGWNTPPAHALSRRGLTQNVRGYTLYGDYSRPNPPARIIAAVAEGEVDAAVAWGPMAGYFAARQSVPLQVAPVRPQFDGPQLPMVWDISMGVRKEDEALRQEIDAALERRRADIDAILNEYGVPRLDRRSRRAEAAP